MIQAVGWFSGYITVACHFDVTEFDSQSTTFADNFTKRLKRSQLMYQSYDTSKYYKIYKSQECSENQGKGQNKDRIRKEIKAEI